MSLRRTIVLALRVSVVLCLTLRYTPFGSMLGLQCIDTPRYKDRDVDMGISCNQHWIFHDLLVQEVTIPF